MKALNTVASFLNSRIFVVLVFIFIAFFYASNSDRYYGWTDKESKDGEPIVSDGSGYYAHLPRWFIYKTDDFSFTKAVFKKYPQSRFTENIYLPGKGDPVNKYYTGTAVALSPFFLVGHAWALNSDHDADGYSPPYLIMISVACIFYVLLGCLGIYFLLRKFAIGRFWIMCSIIVIVLGTNIGFYTYIYSPYSHVFSFAVIAWLLYAAKSWADRHVLRFFLLFCSLLGLAVIIRPTNVLVLAFVPFLFPATRSFLERIRSLFLHHKWHTAAGVAVFALLVVFQLWNVHTASGKWALNSYAEERFAFLGNPKILEVLFSWRKGLFIFAPVLLLIVPGWVVLFRTDRRLFWGSVLFFALFTYVTASWWCWWYGGGLGMRPYIDVYPLLIIPVAFLFHYSRVWVRLIVLPLAVIGCQMGQVYEFQMKHNILHYDDMTYEQFRSVFMKKGLRFSWSMSLEYEHLPKSGPAAVAAGQFSYRGKPMPRHTFLKLLGDDYGDNPKWTFIPQPSDSAFYFGARINGFVYLYSEDTNPAFYVKYYKNGEVHETPYYVGQFIPEVEKLQPVELEIFPAKRYASFDSMIVEFAEGNTFTGVQGLTISRYSYRSLR